MTRIQSGVLATLLVAGLVACASAPLPVRRVTTRGEVSRAPLPRPNAASGPCASVTTTTPIGQVPAACAALWAPYGVTKVPPANLTDSTPVPPTVINETRGAVSDAQARAWLVASNRASVWYRWAEGNDQLSLIGRLGQVMLVPPAELSALTANEDVIQPACALFPTRVGVFILTQSDRKFFESLGEQVKDTYVFASHYPGPCQVTAMTASGTRQLITSYPSDSVTVFASHMVSDPLLGDILYVDGAGNCTDPGAPTSWCSM